MSSAEGDSPVLMRDIDFFSLCEHHLLPFRIHVGYIPGRRIIGLSKIPRIVEVFARRFQVQERLTEQVADALVDTLEPKGVVVVTEAQHLCMAMRPRAEARVGHEGARDARLLRGALGDDAGALSGRRILLIGRARREGCSSARQIPSTLRSIG